MSRRSAAPRCSGEWQTVQSALGNWAMTAQLCLIFLFRNAPVGLVAWMIWQCCRARL